MHSIRRDIIQSLFPSGKYLTYSEGKSNVLISAPHGGGIKPIHMPKRKYGNRLKDTYTRRLTEKVINYLSPIKPFYVYSDIHRSRVDLNREIVEAAQGNTYAERVWNEWNTLLKYYQNEIRRLYGTGLYIDIHSHNDGDYFELGYNLNARDYLNAFESGKINATTTIDSIGKSKVYDALFGKSSFHQQLKFYDLTPFMPDGHEVYFNGGRDVEVFSGNGISAIQIECPVSILKKELDYVARALANIISDFRDTYVVVQ